MEALPPLSAWASMSSQLQGSIFLVFGLVSIAFSEYFGSEQAPCNGVSSESNSRFAFCGSAISLVALSSALSVLSHSWG